MKPALYKPIPATIERIEDETPSIKTFSIRPRVPVPFKAGQFVELFVPGVGETTREAPKENLLGTPWWTDGNRVVMVLSDTPVPLEEIEILDWTDRYFE